MSWIETSPHHHLRSSQLVLEKLKCIFTICGNWKKQMSHGKRSPVFLQARTETALFPHELTRCSLRLKTTSHGHMQPLWVAAICFFTSSALSFHAQSLQLLLLNSCCTRGPNCPVREDRTTAVVTIWVLDCCKVSPCLSVFTAPGQPSPVPVGLPFTCSTQSLTACLHRLCFPPPAACWPRHSHSLLARKLLSDDWTPLSGYTCDHWMLLCCHSDAKTLLLKCLWILWIWKIASLCAEEQPASEKLRCWMF